MLSISFTLPLGAMLRLEGNAVGRRHVRTLMETTGIDALYKKPNTSRRHTSHAIYPWLLSKTPLTRPGQVYATDITYIPMRRAFVYCSR